MSFQILYVDFQGIIHHLEIPCRTMEATSEIFCAEIAHKLSAAGYDSFVINTTYFEQPFVFDQYKFYTNAVYRKDILHFVHLDTRADNGD